MKFQIRSEVLTIAYTTMLLAFVVCSCGETHTPETKVDDTALVPAVFQEEQRLKDSISKAFILKDSLYIGYFSEHPSEIDGCSNIYSSDLENYTQRRFIYMGNLDSLAFMKINGSMIRFTLTASEETNEHKWTYTFSSSNYDLIVEEYYDERTGDEVWTNYGIITLSDNQGKTTKLSFVGEGGC